MITSKANTVLRSLIYIIIFISYDLARVVDQLLITLIRPRLPFPLNPLQCQTTCIVSLHPLLCIPKARVGRFPKEPDALVWVELNPS